MPGAAAARLVRFTGMTPRRLSADCADVGAATMPAGRAAGVRVKNAPTSLSQRRMRTPGYHLAAISARQRTLYAGIGVGEAQAPASEKVLYLGYTRIIAAKG